MTEKVLSGFLIVLFHLIHCNEAQKFVFDVTMNYRAPDCVSKPIALVNGQFPGPTIRVVANSMVEVKVVNKLATDSITIHFHGQKQLGTVWQDGIGMISSCPILPHTSFTYRFKANDAPGTYSYHGHIGGIRAAGLYGMFIIDPKVGKPKPFVYDKEHSLLLSDWYHASHTELGVGLLEEKFRWTGDPQSLLINGKGFYNCTKHGVTKDNSFPYYTPSGTVYCSDSLCPGHEVIEVTKNTVNLVRIGNIAELSFMNIAIQGHNMTVVEADGAKIKPIIVSSLDINSGQRYAVLVNANQNESAYWINVKTRHRSGVVTGQAILKYKTSPIIKPLDDVETAMAFQPKWDDSSFSFAQQSSMSGLTTAPTKETRRIVMLGTQERFQWKQGVGYNDHKISSPENNCNATGRNLRWAVNGASYRWENTPVAHMVYYDIRQSSFTENRGYYRINEGDVIDIIIQNYPACNQVCEQHPWHLHGHKFWVIGMGKGTWNGNATQIASLQPQNAVYRDTTTVIPDSVMPFSGQSKQGGCGWTAVRFIADNPGVWPFHCHVTWHFVMGMQAIFIESPNKIPAPGNDIPICGEVTPQMFMKKHDLVKREKPCKIDIRIWLGLTVGWCFALCLLIAVFYQCIVIRKARPRQNIADISMRSIKT